MHPIDHAVLVVGYGTLEQHDYWLVKNRYHCILYFSYLFLNLIKTDYPLVSCKRSCSRL